MKPIVLYNLLDSYKKDLEEMLNDVQESLGDAYELDNEGTMIEACEIAEKDLLHGVKLISDLQKYMKENG